MKHAGPGIAALPVSWLTVSHVTEGRKELNFSMWGYQEQPNVEAILESIRDGDMPEKSYLLMHPEARLSNAERRALMVGLQVSLYENEANRQY